MSHIWTPTDPTVWQTGDIPTEAEIKAQLLDNLEYLKERVPLLWDSAEAGVSFPAASVSTPTLPATYKHLRIVLSARCDMAAVNFAGIGVRFNGDTGAHYDGDAAGDSNGAFGRQASGVAITQAYFGLIVAASGAAGLGGIVTACVPNYSDVTTFYKQIQGLSYAQAQLTAAYLAPMIGGGQWRDTAAITSLTFLPQSGNFVAGTRISVYGEVAVS